MDCIVAFDVSDKVVAGNAICAIKVLFAAVAGVNPLFRNALKTVATLVPRGSQLMDPQFDPLTASAVIINDVVPVPSLAIFAAVNVAHAALGINVKIGAKFGMIYTPS